MLSRNCNNLMYCFASWEGWAALINGFVKNIHHSLCVNTPLHGLAKIKQVGQSFFAIKTGSPISDDR